LSTVPQDAVQQRTTLDAPSLTTGPTSVVRPTG
jgi:hypothetical protein